MAEFCPIKNNFALYTECLECKERECDYFYCLVVGSRTFENYEYLKSKLEKILQNFSKVIIVSGGADGADKLAEKYAEEKGCRAIIFPAKWDLYGKSAGFRRNEEMHAFLSKCKKRGCVAFWDGESKGTAQNFELAKKYKNPIRIIKFKEKNDENSNC